VSGSQGVEWLEEIPQHWNIKKLKYLANIKTGDKDKADRVEEGQYPFFIRSPKIQRIDTYSYNEEAVLTAGDGDIGKIFHYINGKFEYHQRVYKFSDFRGINGKFLYYFLHRNLAEEVIKLSAKSTVDSLRLPMLQNFPVCYPDVEEQIHIASFLDCKTAEIDEAIAYKQRLIELLQEQKAILINQAVTKGLNPDAPMRDSGFDWIGEIPSSWQLKRVKHIFRLIVDPAPDNNYMELLSVYSDIGVRPRRELEERGNKASTTDGYWLVKKGDVIVNKLLAWMGAIGLSNYDGVTSPAYDVLRPRIPISGEYYNYLFRMPSCTSELKKHSRGIMEMRLRLYFDRFGVIEVPYPPIEDQKAIARFLKEQEEEFEKAFLKIREEISLLEELKAVLISKSVTGKIKV
jgi:type I restriction enzyme S subunit